MGFLVVPGCVKATGDIQQESQRMLRDRTGIGPSRRAEWNIALFQAFHREMIHTYAD